MAQQDIVGSLFGVTPEMYQQQKQQQQLAEAIKMGSLTPEQFVGTQAYRGGQAAGNVLGGLLGVEDPQLQAIRGAQSIINKYDISTSRGLKQVTQELQQLAQTTGNNAYLGMAQDAAKKYKETLLNEATVSAKLREQVSGFGKLVRERDAIATENPNDPRIAEYNKMIAAEQEGKAPKFNIPLNLVDKESNNRKDFVTETKPYRDVYTTAGKIDSLLNQGPLGEIIAKKQFSKLAGDNNISNRDVADLSNFGDLGQRLAGTLSRFANGEYSEAQLQEAKNLVKQLKKESESSYNEIKGQYRTRLAGEKLPEKTINFIAPDLPSSKLSLQLPSGVNYKEGAIVSIKGHEGKKFVIRNGKAEEQ